MINKKAYIGLLLLLTLAFAGCSSGLPEESSGSDGSQSRESTAVMGPSREVTREPETEPDPLEEQIRKMTLEEKIGQMVIVGLDGYEVDENAASMIREHLVGGFILFRTNVKSSGQLLALINALKKENSDNKVPLFLSVDEEGGRISRMPEDINKLPSNKESGEVNDRDFSYQIGGLLAQEIKAFGFNIDFAPVLDIFSNPKNTVIGDRAFGSDADIVSKLGIETMKGIREGGVIPVVKHFPGHGDTTVDSHVGLPSIDYDMDRLTGFELVPFKAAIDNQADAVMVAHILLSKIDAENPATMSEAIITGLLRNRLGFNGVVITDDMTMGAIVDNYDIGDAAVRSVNAGSDIVLVCHGNEKRLAVIDALIDAADNGTITEQRLNESVYRILKMKSKYGLKDDTVNPVDIEEINRKINAVLKDF